MAKIVTYAEGPGSGRLLGAAASEDCRDEDNSDAP
jgi:hypothetical protein